MVDIHAHILPGLDDGAANMEEALAMAVRAAREGIRHMAATSHGNYFAYTLDEYRAAFSKLQKAIEREQIPLKLYPGMEIFLDDDALAQLKRGSLLPLNHTDYLLAEFAFDENPRNVLRRLTELRGTGYRVVIAHPERYRFIQREPELAYFLAEQEYVLQINGGSLIGDFGRAAHSLAVRMLEDKIVSVIATDAHDGSFRPPVMRRIEQRLKEIYTEAEVHLWMSENPGRILKGRPVIR